LLSAVSTIAGIEFAPIISFIWCRMNHPHRSPIWIKVVDIGSFNRLIQHPWRHSAPQKPWFRTVSKMFITDLMVLFVQKPNPSVVRGSGE
jgi:hypothetical protein